MPVETHTYQDGKIISVTVPIGTQFYSERGLKRNSDFLGDIIRTYQAKGPDSLEEIAKKYSKDLGAVEKALVRLIHTFNNNPIGPSFVIDTLGLHLVKGERFYSEEGPTVEHPIYSLLT